MWFRIDDDCFQHPKWLGASDAEVALWTRAGAWCARYLTDGRIPAEATLQLGCTTRRTLYQASLLVSRGLWIPDGDTFVFHDWTDFQPSRQSVLARRAAGTERRKRYLHGTSAKNNGVTHGVTDGVTHGVTDGVTHGVTDGVTDGGTNAVANGDGNAPPDPAPKNPPPTPPPEPGPSAPPGAENGGENFDPVEQANQVVISAIRDRTGRELTREQANALRVQLTAGKSITHPAMYVARVIGSHADPGSLLPQPAAPRKRNTGPPPARDALRAANLGRPPMAADAITAATARGAADARARLAERDRARRDAQGTDDDEQLPGDEQLPLVPQHPGRGVEDVQLPPVTCGDITGSPSAEGYAGQPAGGDDPADTEPF